MYRRFAILLAALLLAGCGAEPVAPPEAAPPAAPAQELSRPEPALQPFISSATQWLYLDREQQERVEAAGQAWTLHGYDSSGWRRGPGPFGAKDGTLQAVSEEHQANTLLNQYLEDGGKNAPSFFFRTSFHVADPMAIPVLRGEVAYDDAIIIYLNGEKVFEGNVPEEGFEDNFSYGAAVPQGRPIAESVRIPAELLLEGENVLAVELHQSDRSSSDLYFDFISLASQTGAFRSSFLGVGPDGTGVSINWIQEGRAVPDASVYIRKIGSSQPPAQFQASETEPNDVGHSYRAHITGLEPDTRYSYTISGGDEILKTGSFRTGSPEDGTDMLLLGDPQLDMDDYQEYIDGFSLALEDAAGGMDLMVCLGDVAVNAWDYPVYEAAVNSLQAAGLPTAMVFGNHDEAGECLSDSVNLPNMTEWGASRRTGAMSGDYWFEYGGCLFLCLNSNESDYDQHSAFMEEAEAAFRAQYGEPAWRVVFMHHALFSQGNNYAKDSVLELREALAPLFSERDVDVVFSGHDHTYSRSYLMRGAGIVPYEGGQAVRWPGEVLYVSLGSATGAKYYDLSGQQPYTAFCEQNYRAMLTRINITPRRLHMTTWEPEGQEVIDSFALMK